MQEAAGGCRGSSEQRGSAALKPAVAAEDADSNHTPKATAPSAKRHPPPLPQSSGLTVKRPSTQAGSHQCPVNGTQAVSVPTGRSAGAASEQSGVPVKPPPFQLKSATPAGAPGNASPTRRAVDAGSGLSPSMPEVAGGGSVPVPPQPNPKACPQSGAAVQVAPKAEAAHSAQPESLPARPRRKKRSPPQQQQPRCSAKSKQGEEQGPSVPASGQLPLWGIPPIGGGCYVEFSCICHAKAVGDSTTQH